MLQCFFGHDERVAAGTTAFVRSAIQHARTPISLVPITAMATYAGVKQGTNAFTFRRFLVPWMMGWNGWALFVDGSDMLCRADLNDIMEHLNWYAAVQVVKHDYKTKHARKYVGTAMEADNADYERKNWCSVMLLNTGHFAWRKVDPEFIDRATPLDLLQLRFIPDELIGELPVVWNWISDEYGENPDAKLCHFTAGVPGMEHYANSPMAAEWHAALAAANTVTG